jgi:hypothetical protein
MIGNNNTYSIHYYFSTYKKIKSFLGSAMIPDVANRVAVQAASPLCFFMRRAVCR